MYKNTPFYRFNIYYNIHFYSNVFLTITHSDKHKHINVCEHPSPHPTPTHRHVHTLKLSQR